MLKQLGRELQESKTLQLASVSPQLLQARGLELAVLTLALTLTLT